MDAPDALADWLLRPDALPQYRAGRRPDNDWVLANPKVSGYHARLTQCSDRLWLVEDLDSKNGTFVNGLRVQRKLVGPEDALLLADEPLHPTALAAKQVAPPEQAALPEQPDSPEAPLDFTQAFADLKLVFEQYPQLRKDCRKREKMIRTASVLLSSAIGIGATLATAGSGLLVLHVMSGAGLSILLPTLCSTLLSTEEKIELIDRQFKERYRCPNPDCRDPFGMREWEQLARQKKCPRCKAVWVA